jgi:hypothetical protein
MCFIPIGTSHPIGAGHNVLVTAVEEAIDVAAVDIEQTFNLVVFGLDHIFGGLVTRTKHKHRSDTESNCVLHSAPPCLKIDRTERVATTMSTQSKTLSFCTLPDSLVLLTGFFFRIQSVNYAIRKYVDDKPAFLIFRFVTPVEMEAVWAFDVRPAPIVEDLPFAYSSKRNSDCHL